jgi:Histidine phosphatase superfamily (branch 1)
MFKHRCLGRLLNTSGLGFALCRHRRRFVVVLVGLLLGASAWAQTGNGSAWEALKTPGTILLFRHALAPGVGDPDGFVLGNCATQRNLNEEGRAQARSLGEAIQSRSVLVGAVWHSQWCRTQDTAHLAFPNMPDAALRAEPAFNSFFSANQERALLQTQRARTLLLKWSGPGILVVFTHQVNITALTGIVPQSAEGVVVQAVEDGELIVRGCILP